MTGESVRDAVLTDLGLPVDRVHCIPPGVDDGWRPKPSYASTARRLLCLSNYVAGKGHLRLLDALSELVDLEWTLATYGNANFEPGFRAAVRERADALGLSDRVTVNDAVSHEEVNHLMVSADLLVQFSADESYSMVTAEALACGLPVLSHPTGAVRAFSRHGSIAYVDTLDRARAVRALRGLMSNAGDYGRLCAHRPPPARPWRQVARAFADVLERHDR